MKPLKIITVLGASLWTMFPLYASAQTADSISGSNVWTFSRCVERAVESNPEIRRNVLSILDAEESIGSAKDAWLPSVGFSTSHNFANQAVCHNMPSVPLLSEFGLSHILMYTPIVLILNALHLTFSDKT
ncbi:MAG: TolC family protein [Muribaculaceae bacterium]|nr:TolC family protein [Muribaculaceae bacterium]